jgi:deoxyribose-phosphate aldolase
MLLSSHIDHTLLRPDAQLHEIDRLCKEAIAHQFAAVCVSPYFAGNCVDRLRDHYKIKVASVVGFPMGFNIIASKADEIRRLAEDDVDEIDAVANISAVKNGNWKWVYNDIQSMTGSAHVKGKVIKIIFETGMLTNDEIIRLCDVCNEVGVDFAKTSTGFLGSGASTEVISLMRKHLDASIKIKASGGIRTREQAEAMLAAGAVRIGTSNGVGLMNEMFTAARGMSSL